MALEELLLRQRRQQPGEGLRRAPVLEASELPNPDCDAGPRMDTPVMVGPEEEASIQKLG